MQINELSNHSTDYKTVTAECGNTEMVNVLVTESYARLRLYKDNNGAVGDEIIGATPVIGGKVHVALEITIGAGQRVDDALSSLTLRRREDSELHTEADDRIDKVLSLDESWQKWNGTNWDAQENPKTANNGTEAVKYRKAFLWATALAEEVTGQKLWNHNGEHEVKVLEKVAFEAAGGTGPVSLFPVAPKNPELANLVIGKMPSGEIATTNLSPDYFILDSASVIEGRQEPELNFKIEDKGDPHQYKWKIYLHPTWLPYDEESAFPDHPYAYLEGTAAAGETVTVQWNGKKTNNAGEEAEDGIYAFDIYVEELENAAAPGTVLDKTELRAPYKLQLVEPYSQIHKASSTKLKVAYDLQDADDTNAAKVQVDVRDEDWNLTTSITEGLPVAAGQNHGPLDAWTVPSGVDPWNLRILFIAEDSHGSEQREHRNRRSLAMRQEQRILEMQYSADSGVTWQKVPETGDATYPLTIDQYSYLDFRVMKTNPDRPWSEDKPDWSGDYWNSEVGEVNWEYFDQASQSDADLKWVKVEAGNSKTAYVKVLPVTLIPEVTLGVAADISDREVPLSWWTNIAAEELGWYELHRSAVPNFTPTEQTLIAEFWAPEEVSYIDRVVVPNTTYYYTLVAVDWIGQPILSNEISVTTDALNLGGETDEPCPIELEADQMSEESAHLYWTFCSNDEFSSYKLHRSTQEDFVATESNRIDRGALENQREKTEYSDSGLQPDTIYYYALVVTHGGQTTETRTSVKTLAASIPQLSFEGLPRACAGGIAVDGTHDFTITGILKNANGNPVANEPIKFVFENNRGHNYLEGERLDNQTGVLHRAKYLPDPLKLQAEVSGSNGEAMTAITNAEGRVDIHVLSSDTISNDIKIVAKWTDQQENETKVGVVACDFGELESYRRFPNQYDPDEVEDTGWLFDFPRLQAPGDITPAKVYFKFVKDLSVGDVNGNWSNVVGHQLRIKVVAIALNDGEVVEGSPDALKTYAFVTDGSGSTFPASETTAYRITNSVGAAPQAYVRTGSAFGNVATVIMGADLMSQWHD